MTYYETQILKIRSQIYANQGQLDTVIGIRRFMERHYDLPLDLDSLSHHHLVSKFHLLRLFKRYYGQTPRQYLIDLRIKKAKGHLKRGMTVTETCFAVGFESVGSFSTLFKKKSGLSPRAYQKEQLSRSICLPDLGTFPPTKQQAS